MAGTKFIKVKIAPELLQNLKRAEGQVLPELAPLAEAAASAALERSKAAVPVDSGELLASAYSKSASVNVGEHIASAEAGYAADHAAYVHEIGSSDGIPSKFLSKATRKGRAKYRKAVVARLAEVLSRLFPSK